MPILHQPHDKLFKLSMAELAVAREFFEKNLPAAILKNIDLNSLKLEKESFIDEAYKDTEADVVYSVKMGNATTYLYLLCEEQTEVDEWLAFRVLVYTVRIMELHKKQHPGESLALVYPMVVYIGDEEWDAPLDIFPLFGDAENLAKELMFKPYQLLDVQRISDDELYQDMLFGLVAFAMKYRETADFQRFLKKLVQWAGEVEVQYEAGTSVARLVLKYVIDCGPEDGENLLIREAQDHLSETLRGEIMTIAQRWEEKGVQKGMQQGEATILQYQLQKRFGDLPAIYTQRIADADPTKLLYWAGKVLDAKTLADVFN